MPKHKTTHSYSSEEIVKDIKEHIKTASDLYESYLESQASFMIDTVTNAEFLRHGWSDNLIYQDTVVKEVEESFSFLINLTEAQELVVTAALKGEDLYLHPASITFFVKGKEIGVIEVKYSHLGKYSLPIPKEFRIENVTVTAKVKKEKNSSQLLVRSLIAVHSDIKMSHFQESLFELERIKRDTNQLIQVLEWHKNPELLLPADSKKNLVKKVIKKSLKVASRPFRRFSDALILKRIVLKLMRPFTTPQIMFNEYLLEIIQLQTKRNDKLEELLMTMMKVDKKQDK